VRPASRPADAVFSSGAPCRAARPGQSGQQRSDELNNAKTDEVIENAVITVRTLCED